MATEPTTDDLPEELKLVLGTLAHNRSFTILDLKSYAQFERPSIARHAAAIVRKLLSLGYVTRVGHGRYFPTQEGWAWIEGSSAEDNPLPGATKIALIAGVVVIAGGIAALLLSKSASAQPAALPSGLPLGPYKRLAGGAVLLPNKTYLASLTPSSSPGSTLADALGELKQTGASVLGSWDVGKTPAGWPSDDPNPNGFHVAFTLPSTWTPQSINTTVAIWATGGSST